MLEIKSVNKKFGEREILKGIDLTVKNGEIIGLLGKNGAGKTTLIKCINQLYKFQGTVRVNGLTYEESPTEYLKNVGILLEPSYYDYMSATENLKAYASLSGVRFQDVEREIKELLDIIGLGDAMEKKVKEFSFGMKQKLGVAMAFVKKPDVLVLDEPSIGVDPKGLDSMFEMLKTFARRDNMAIIFSSNNLKEVQDISDKISFLKDGKIIQTLTTSEMLDLENSYTITVRNPISEGLAATIQQMGNSHAQERIIKAENYEDMNRIVKLLVQDENMIMDIERENKFLKAFYS